MATHTFKELEMLLERKRKNDEILSEEDKKGKYRKAYDGLVKQIKDTALSVSINFLMSGYHFAPEDDEEHQKMNNDVIKLIRSEPYFGIIQNAIKTVAQTYNINDGLCKLIPIYNKIVYEIYKPYWLSKCVPCNVPGYSHFNTIVGMWYDTKSKVWSSETEGRVSIGLFLPPTEEMIVAEYLKESN